jgi:hypothetical protein
MQVEKSRLVNLFVLLGCPKAEKWSNEVLEGRVGAICELFDLSTPIEKPYRKLFEKVYAAAKTKEEIIIIDDAEEPVVEPIKRIDANLRLPPFETPVEQQERQKGKKKPKNIEPVKKCKRDRGQSRYSEYLSEWGTWKWMPGHIIDQFFLNGGMGTIAEIAEATKRKRVSVQQQLLVLLRFGLVVWGENDVFRAATREERIDFIDHGIKEKFRPMGVFVVRKPDFEDMEGGVDV